MPDEDNKILKYNHRENPMRVPFIIYADSECLLEKMHSCQNHLEKSCTEKKTKLPPSGYSLFTNCSFDATKNKPNCYICYICKKGFSADNDNGIAFTRAAHNKYHKVRDHCH